MTYQIEGKDGKFFRVQGAIARIVKDIHEDIEHIDVTYEKDSIGVNVDGRVFAIRVIPE